MGMSQYFSDEERASIAHLQGLVLRQVQMGVPPEAAAAILAMAAGQVAAATGWDRDKMIEQLRKTMEAGFDGYQQGAQERKGG